MRQPKNNRRFYWLPLLCVIWTVSASAQTWTTVWTPDSVPAAKTTTKDGTHESKTNCYPCKEWEDYGDNKGKWVNYPEGTEPVICDDDDTDYTCKECDGEGGVRNKADGTDCSLGSPSEITFGLKLGCCKEGECTPGRSLVDWADFLACPKIKDNPQHQSHPTTPPCGPIPGTVISPLSHDFDTCCVDHDLCYGECLSDKSACDEALLSCMEGICAGMSGDTMNCDLQTAAATLWFHSGGGQSQFEDAQIAACNCCD